MKEEELQREVDDEFNKDYRHLARDVIEEANTLPEKPAGEKENLDIIKHLIKRMAVHHLSLEHQAKRTNRILIFLSVVMALGALTTLVDFLIKLCGRN